MKTLQQLRNEINACDDMLVRAMQRRLAAVRQVADYKAAHALPIYQPGREREVLEFIGARVDNPLDTPHIVALYKWIMDNSRGIQAAMNIPQSIALIGFMGSGKTTVGRALAACIGFEFVDSDDEIERVTGMSVCEMFTRCGEAAFREREREIIASISERRGIVVACGGGAALDVDNIQALKRNALLCWLVVQPETVLQRLQTDKSRPLMAHKSAEEVSCLLAERESHYAGAADCLVKADGASDEVVAAVLAAVAKLC